MARKVVGVGSVGTQACILLMEAEDDLDPLLLQAKQAERSVLSAYAGESQYDNQGERVVVGPAPDAGRQRHLPRLAARHPCPVSARTDFYLRQLRDWKYSAADRADVCCGRWPTTVSYAAGRSPGLTPAPVTASRSLPTSAVPDKFEQAVADFGVSYADQTERDHAALADAAASGLVEARTGV